jgi:uncharacterized paraquat-inducible protein A
MTAIMRAAGYGGPACPRCKKSLDVASLRDGEEVCPSCNVFFEARVFHPPQRTVHVTLAGAGPQGSNPCANHPRNAAMSNCQRCGVFICSLCELDVSGTRYCPSCFDRVSQEGGIGATQLRFRDFRGLAMFVGFVGLVLSILLGIPLGILTIYYAIKGLRDRNVEGSSRVPVVMALLLGVLDIALGCLFVYSMFHKTP